MPQFRKKPVEIEARQFTKNDEPDFAQVNELIEWVNEDRTEGAAYFDGTAIYIPTLDGVHRATLNDWIIKGVKGEFYPCKPDIFDISYDPV